MNKNVTTPIPFLQFGTECVGRIPELVNNYRIGSRVSQLAALLPDNEVTLSGIDATTMIVVCYPHHSQQAIDVGAHSKCVVGKDEKRHWRICLSGRIVETEDTECATLNKHSFDEYFGTLCSNIYLTAFRAWAAGETTRPIIGVGTTGATIWNWLPSTALCSKTTACDTIEGPALAKESPKSEFVWSKAIFRAMKAAEEYSKETHVDY
jgi:hypothetical protein